MHSFSIDFTADQVDVYAEQYVKGQKTRQIDQVEVTSFLAPFNTEIFLAKLVSQTLFFVILDDCCKCIKNWRIGTCKSIAKSHFPMSTS